MPGACCGKRLELRDDLRRLRTATEPTKFSVRRRSRFADRQELGLVPRNGRGRNALKASIAGDGLGLYLAKVLCNIHGVQITAGSAGETVYQVKGVDYEEFVAQLRFRKYSQ